ncbi:SPFH domain-containing protein [bacterium]|nr:SPFH domain-containing protein [bacterium]
MKPTMRPFNAVSAFALAASTIAGVAIGLTLMALKTDQHGQPNPLFVLVPAGIGAMLGLVLSTSLQVVAQWERMVVLRFGRFQRTVGPGLHAIFPVLDSPIFVEMRVQTVDVAQQQAITQDNVPVILNGVIFFKVEDAEKAALRVESYHSAISRLAQATLRDVVGRLSLDELLSHQEKLELEIEQAVAVQSKAWGLTVEAIKLEDIEVPEDLKKMMSRQASSEREKRATIIKAEGDRQAAAALAEAAATMHASPGAMNLRVLQTLDGLGPSPSNTVVLALPIDVMEAVRAYTRALEPPKA